MLLNADYEGLYIYRAYRFFREGTVEYKSEATSELIRDLKGKKYCAVIEVTNGLCREQYQRKVSEAKQAAGFIREFLGPESELDAGIIFYNNPNARFYKTQSMDFILEAKKIEHDLARKALEEIAGELDTSDERKMAKKLLKALHDGMQIQQLFYPSQKNFDTILKTIGHSKDNPSNIKAYIDLVSNIKGKTLEEYTAQYFSEQVPEVEIHQNVPYTIWTPRNGKEKRDIDVLLVASDEEIMKQIRGALSNKQAYHIRGTKRKHREILAEAELTEQKF